MDAVNSEAERLAKQKADNSKLKARQIEAAAGKGPTLIAANKNSKYKIKESDQDHVVVLGITKEVDPMSKSVTVIEKQIPVWPRQLAEFIKVGTFQEFDDVSVIHSPKGFDVAADVNLKPEQRGPSGEPVGAAAKDLDTRKNELDAQEARIKEMLKQVEGFAASKGATSDKPSPGGAKVEGAGTTGGQATVDKDIAEGKLPAGKK